MLVFGHGAPASREILSRRKTPRQCIFAVPTVRAAGKSVLLLWASYSHAHFQDAVKEHGVPFLVGFSDQVITPETRDVLSRTFGHQEAEDIVGFYRRLFVDLAVSLVGALFSPASADPIPARCAPLVTRCQNRLRDAADECRRRRTKNAHYWGHQDALLRNSRRLKCV
jgi:hypothetical protein